MALRLRGRRERVAWNVHEEIDGDGLIDWAEQIGGALQARGVGPGAVVGLRLDRGPGALAAQLGVLIAGAAWLPLDPAHPEARQAQLLEDAGAALLLTEGAPPPAGCPCPAIPLAAARGPRLAVGLQDGSPDAPAYVLYTSGSTGRPKGALLSHRSLALVLEGMSARLGLGPADRALATAPFAFDMSIVDTWMPLWAGGSVFLLDAAATQDGEALAAALAEQRITHWNATPSTLRLALAARRPWGGPLRVLSAGERLSAELAAALLARGVRLWNGYGLTETGIGSAFHPVTAVEPEIPAGAPLPGVSLQICGPDGAALPAGHRGEVVIGGPGLMSGYLGRPAETAARLRGAPPCFFTGDAGYLRPDGLLVVTGRLDDQVKVRGLRVEPAEIEAALLAHPALREVAVAARPGPGGELRLCAYLAPRGALAEDALRIWLAARLPAPMVPQDLVWLEALPRSVSGKIDRAALPAPSGLRPAWLPPFRAPATDDEALLVRLMGELLGQEVGADDPLIDLGGRSIEATALAARLAELRGLRLPVSAILGERGSAAALALRLLPGPPPTPPVRDVQDSAPAPAAVAGIWALSCMEPGSAAWCTAIALRAQGPGDRRAAAQALWEGVGALRARISADGSGRPRLWVTPPGPAPLRELATAAEEAAFLGAPAAVDGGPLARLGLTADGRLLVWMHHCVADAWSVGLLAQRYADALAGCTPPRAGLGLLDLAGEEAANAAQGEALAAAWAERLRGAPLRNDLPGAGRAPRAGGPADTVPVPIDPALGEAISALARRGRATPAAVVLAGLAAWLFDETGQDDQLIGLVLAGREGPGRAALIANLARALPVRLRPRRGLPGAALVAEARAALLDAADHSEAPLAAVVARLAPPRAPDHQALFQVCFVGQDGPPRARRQGPVAVQAEELDLGASPYDLLLRAEGEGVSLRLRLTARHSRVDPRALPDLAAGLRRQLVRLCAAPEAPLAGAALTAAAAALRRQVPCEDADVVWVPGEGPPLVGLVSGGPAPAGARLLSALPRDAAGWLEPAAARAALAAPASPARSGVLHRADLLPGGRIGGAPSVAATASSSASPARRAPALRIGPPALPLPATGLAALLEQAAASSAPLTFLDAALQPVVLGYADLWAEARAVAGGLRRAGLGPGQAAVLAFSEARDLVGALWGCFLAGVAALPVAAPPGPGPSEARLRLGQAVDLLGGAPVLTDPALEGALGGRRWLDGVALRQGRPDGDPHPAGLDDLALLLLTSGSTGAPKAVTHGARTLLSFLAAYGAALDLGPSDVFLNWLGLDHVAPLLMVHASAVRAGAAQVHAPTWAFLAAPARALDWTHRYRATTTFAPNFAFGLLADAAAGAPEGAWDLRCARAFTNGGETLVPATTRRFLDAAGRFGFPEAAMVPIWGMSETCSATILRAGPGRGNAAGDPGTDLGGPVAGFAMRVVDEAGALRLEGEVGRLQVQGVTVTPGYLRRPEANAAAFTADGWFDTGDLGFIDAAGLTLTGRAKDLLIVAGRNLGCHEVEAVVEALPGVARSFVAATPLRPPGAETDEVGVFFATDLPDDALPGLYAAARAALGAQLGLSPACLLAVPRADIPKTEIGKLQRSRLRARFEAGDFDAALRAADLRCENERTLPDWFAAPSWSAAPPWPADGQRWLVAAEADDPRGMGLPGARRLRHAEVAAALLAEGPVGLLWVEPRRGGDGVAGAIEAALALQGALKGPAPSRLVVATDGLPQRAGALGGLLASLVEERAGLCGRIVEDADAEALIAEATRWGPSMERLRYRQGARLRLGWRAPAWSSPGPLPYEPGALVLISGGAGALGACVAAALLRRGPVCLLLLGRRPADDADVAAVLDGLAPLVRARPGAQLRYVAADVAEGPALEAALAAAEAAWGRPLRLALHLAGVADLRLFGEEDRAGLERAVAARACGLRTLGAAVASRPGARLIRFGSLNDQLGGFAAGAYAFAGGLAAAMAEALGATSLSWSAWTGRGLGRLGGSGEGARRRGLLPISEEAGLVSLFAALHQPPGDLAIGLSAAHPGLRARWQGLPLHPLAAPPAPSPARVAEAPQTETERRLAALWRELLGRSSVGRDDGFFDLGGTSLLLVALHSRLQLEFPGAPRLVELLANPTLRALALRLEAAAGPDPALAEASARGARQRAALSRRRPPEILP